MKKHLLICMNLLVSMLLMAACHSENVDLSAKSEDTGKLDLTSLSLSVDVEDVPLVPHSRVSAPESYDKFYLYLYDASGKKVKTYSYKNMPDVEELTVGKYTLEAASASKMESGFDKAYFKGSTSFEITKDAITTVENIECKLANIQVSATYSDEMKPYMGEDVKVEMWIDENDKITLTPNETRECFLKAPESTEGTTADNALKVRFYGTLDGEQVDKQLVFDGVEAGTWQQVNFNVKIIMEGTLQSVQITADKTTIRKDETITTLPKEDKIDDFGTGGDQPQPTSEITISGASYKGSKFDIDQPLSLTYRDTNPTEIIVNIAATAGIQKLMVNISSTNSDFAEIAKQLGEFDIADEASLGDKKEMLETLGLITPGKTVKGEKNVDFNITKATPLLGGNPGFPGTHTFAITVTDATGKSLKKSLVINVVEK